MEQPIASVAQSTSRAKTLLFAISISTFLTVAALVPEIGLIWALGNLWHLGLGFEEAMAAIALVGAVVMWIWLFRRALAAELRLANGQDVEEVRLFKNSDLE